MNINDWEIKEIEKLYKSIFKDDNYGIISIYAFIYEVIELRKKRDKLFPDKILTMCDVTNSKRTITSPYKQDKKPYPIGQIDQTKKWNNCWGIEFAEVENNLRIYYVGDFIDGEFNGRGTLIYADGQIQHGDFKNGSKDGYIVSFFKNGSKYIGEVKDDQYNGKGTFIYANGNKYIGEWKDNKIHGQGTLTWASGKFAGDKYVGELRNGKQHGQGTYTWADGTIEKGIWKNGKSVKEN